MTLGVRKVALGVSKPASRVALALAGECGSVTGLGLAISNPPTQAQVRVIANKLDELIDALRRV